MSKKHLQQEIKEYLRNKNPKAACEGCRYYLKPETDKDIPPSCWIHDTVIKDCKDYEIFVWSVDLDEDI